jgi:hypothetical protein
MPGPRDLGETARLDGHVDEIAHRCLRYAQEKNRRLRMITGPILENSSNNRAGAHTVFQRVETGDGAASWRCFPDAKRGELRQH